MGTKSVIVKGLPVLGLLLLLLFIKSRPTLFNGNVNKMLPNQIVLRNVGRQERNMNDNIIVSGDEEQAISKTLDQMLGNQIPLPREGRKELSIDDNAAYSANDRPIISKEENKALPNQNLPNKGGQEKTTDDKAASNANDQPIISKEKDKLLPNQNPPNKDEGQDKRMDDKAASSSNDQSIVSKEENKVLPSQNLPNKDGGQDKRIDDKAASSANDQPIIAQEKDEVLPNRNPPNNAGGQQKTIDGKAAPSGNDQPIISKDKVSPNQNPPSNDIRIINGPDDKAPPSSSPTSSEKTFAHILNRRQTYRVGEELLVKIVARDAFSRPKTTGGDFFTAQLTSTSPVQASTAGRITDYGNGTYVARFILGWPGFVTADVRLIHSSEAVNVLIKSRSDKIRRFFSCLFVDKKTNNSEWTSCTFNQNEKANYSRNVCDFSRPDINVTWYCHKPRSAPCEPPTECRQDRNKSLGVDDVFTEEEKALLEGDRVEVQANISLTVKERDTRVERKGLPQCGPRLPEPASEGHWHNGTWYSLRCRAQRGFDRAAAIRCLRNKTIYLQGDSTLRQWYSDLAKTINTEDNPNMAPKFLGPTVTTNKSNNINIHFRFHHFPISGPPPRPMNVFSFAADEIKNMVGGPDVAIILGLWAHFCAEPVETFRSRLYGIRHAIEHLHKRYPDTKIFIRTSNTRGHVTFSHLRDNSNWYAYQLLLETRDILGDLNVTILDVWDMSICQWHEHSVHPHNDVIKNHLDMLYSYICPK